MRSLLKDDPQMRAGGLGNTPQRFHGSIGCPALKTRYNRLGGLHTPCQFLLRKSGLLADAEDGSGHGELVGHRFVCFSIRGIGAPFPMQVFNTAHGFISLALFTASLISLHGSRTFGIPCSSINRLIQTNRARTSRIPRRRTPRSPARWPGRRRAPERRPRSQPPTAR